jgi:flagellar hook-associated protein 1 FlgK
MGAMLDTMNTIIPGILTDLDAVAKSIHDTVNAAQTGAPASGSTPAVPPWLHDGRHAGR